MPDPITNLVMAPISTNKTVAVFGVASVGEVVGVTINGYAQYIAAGMTLRIRHNRTDIARFPLAEGDAWAPDGDDAKCVMTFRTAQAFEAFRGHTDGSTRQCVVLIEVATPETLKVNGVMSVGNWPQIEGEGVPYDLDQWPDLVEALQQQVDGVEQAFAAHSHAGVEPRVSHNDLTDKGTVSHAGLESALANYAAAVADLTAAVASVSAAIAAAQSLAGQHAHTGADGSATVDHASLFAVGTKSHAQLESLIEAAGALAESTASLLQAHKHTGSDGTPALPLTSVDGSASILARLDAAEAAQAALALNVAALDAQNVKKVASSGYTVTAPVSGTHRNISENMTGDEMARCLPTILADLQARGAL